MNPAITHRAFTEETVIDNLPVGCEVVIRCSANISFAFWDPVTGAYDTATEDITTPGAVMACASTKAKVTTVADATLSIHSLA